MFTKPDLRDGLFYCETCGEVEFTDNCGAWNRILDPICPTCFDELTEAEQEDRY
jgi:hypothetical protein